MNTVPDHHGPVGVGASEEGTDRIPTDLGEELVCAQCEVEAESIEHMAEHQREAGH